MKTGILFDIEECAIYESNSLCISIFMKGCPLRCSWCHSPEGQKCEIEKIRRKNGDLLVIGEEWSSNRLASYIDDMNDIFRGCIVFTGGEPLMQADFLLEVFSKIKKNRNDIIIETCGIGDVNKLIELSKHCSKIHFGLKLIDENKNLKYVGVSSKFQLCNLSYFDKHTHCKYDIVVPKIKTLTTTSKYKHQISLIASNLNMLDQIIFLPYNKLTHAKKESWYENECQNSNML